MLVQALRCLVCSLRICVVCAYVTHEVEQAGELFGLGTILVGLQLENLQI